MMRGEVIAIGDELTSGQRLDTNSKWLSERLGEVGVEVMFHTTVGDDLEANVAVFRAAFDRADVVVCTGGLGPTADDLTRQAIADAVGVELVQDDAALDHIRGLYQKRGRGMPERNAVQALFPIGAKPIDNPQGTAPGVAMEVARDGRPPCRVFALPGVPEETHEMWAATVGPAILAAQDKPRVTVHRRVKCFGTGESNLEAMLPDLVRRGREPRVGITASRATLTLRVTASGPDETACLAAIEPTLTTIREVASDLVFGEGDDELQDVVVRLLAERGEKLVVIDDATHGLLGYWLATADLDRKVIQQSVNRHAPPCVTSHSYREWIDPLLNRTDANHALVVGWPEPTGHAKDMTSRIVVASADELQVSQYTSAGHPSLIRDRLAKQAMDLLRRRILGLPMPE